MSTTKDLLKVIDTAARESGRTRKQVFDTLVPTWKLRVGDHVSLLAEISRHPNPPELPDAAPLAQAMRSIADQRRATEAGALLKDAELYLATKATNPLQAAAMLRRNPDLMDALKMIRESAQGETPPPPEAA